MQGALTKTVLASNNRYCHPADDSHFFDCNLFLAHAICPSFSAEVAVKGEQARPRAFINLRSDTPLNWANHSLNQYSVEDCVLANVHNSSNLKLSFIH